MTKRRNALEPTAHRAALVFTVSVLVLISVVCAVFLIAGIEIPNWFVVAGRWIPALVALAVIVAYKLPGGVLEWLQLRPRGFGRSIGGSLISVVVLMAVYVAVAVGYPGAELKPWAAIGQALLLGIPMSVAFVVSNIGEEAAWRGFLQKAFSPWGFWPASIVISVVWVIFHIPLHGTMVLQGALDPHIGVATTVVLFGLGLFLSAVTVRFGSVWPAAFAHAVPFSVLNLVENPEGLSPGHLYGLTAVTIAVLIVVAAVIAPKENQPS
ncbi:CPBP family intramembrane glutamic endopeptidase [Corynebacterium lubricantis]|uniref:CPBP family intramembrane glutamic endopeptidase n=1 Tax=Corynebacterium lubricantis TaxID=541095 RepID=UPI000377A79B|nr:CPBP family intramembrane glutamic endopeptidase [Corynebacterium lubricantis]